MKSWYTARNYNDDYGNRVVPEGWHPNRTRNTTLLDHLGIVNMANPDNGNNHIGAYNTNAAMNGNINVATLSTQKAANDGKLEVKYLVEVIAWYDSASNRGNGGRSFTQGDTHNRGVVLTTVPSGTIRYNANGGKGKMPDSGKNSFGKFVIPINKFTRDGYVLTGWNTKSDGSGTACRAGATIPL
jgi:hypothetical protein